MTTSRANDQSFFLELEKATKSLSVADGGRTNNDLRVLFEELRDAAEQDGSIETISAPFLRCGS